ncbi:MAG: Bax inhibitor-1 family protein [Anaerolineales bacterium]
MWWKFGLQILPVLFMAGFVLGLSYVITPSLDSPVLMISFTAVTVLFFIAMLTFREQYGWNLGLLLGFSAALGGLLSVLATGRGQVVGYEPIWLVLGCLAAGAVAGLWMGSRFGEFGAILWLVSWAYLLGWAALIFLQLDAVFYLTWSVVGLALFTGLAAVWFSHMRDQLEKRSSVSAAVDLYLICINLYLAGMILLSVDI